MSLESPPGSEAALLEHVDRLRRIAAVRLPRSLWVRVDPDDLVQDALLTAVDREPWPAEDCGQLFLWLRGLLLQCIADAIRRHYGAARRSVGREMRAGEFEDDPLQSLVGAMTSPTGAAEKSELRAELLVRLQALEPIDREILELRFLEGLSNREVSALLQLSDAAASNRLARALLRLEGLLSRSAREWITRA